MCLSSSLAATPTSTTPPTKRCIFHLRTSIAFCTTADTVSLGGVTLTAHLTAGHTKGTTTWTFDIPDAGRTLHVVIVGSPNVNPGYKLVHNARYPQIAADYKHQFEVLKNLPCDIFLGAHGGYFDLAEKYPRFKAGDRNAFIDPAGYQAYIADRQQAFEAELKKQSGN